MNTRPTPLRTAVMSALALVAPLNLLAQTAPAVPAVSTAQTAPAAPAVSLIGRATPDIASLPPGPQKALVEYGKQLTERTFAHIGPEAANQKLRYAGNNLACVSCHQGSAAKPFAMPWIGVSASFPQYRAREDDISTVEERVNGCMERSMNGKPLPLNSREMKAFTTYIAFLSQGVPVGATVQGAATVQSKMPNRRADVTAGAAVYAAKCAVCHGTDGLGQRVGKAGDGQGYTFPPLWGPDSFNTGAGMNRLAMATRFVKHNMPLGASHDATQLSDDEAYDVSAFMVSQPRPVKANLELDFPARWNKPVDAAFPPYLLGTADQHKFGPFPPLAEKQKQMAEQLKTQAAAERATGAKR
jgi:thiosulfate dehydrogenase